MPRLSRWIRAAARHHGNGDARRAEHYYRRVLSSCPSHGPALGSLGLLAVKCGRLEEGARLLAQSMAAKPSAEHAVALGFLFERQQSFAAALACFRAAAELDPKAWTLESLAGALDRRGQFEESSTVWARRARKERPGSPQWESVHLHLANALANAGLVRGAATLNNPHSRGSHGPD